MNCPGQPCASQNQEKRRCILLPVDASTRLSIRWLFRFSSSFSFLFRIMNLFDKKVNCNTETEHKEYNVCQWIKSRSVRMNITMAFVRITRWWSKETKDEFISSSMAKHHAYGETHRWITILLEFVYCFAWFWLRNSRHKWLKFYWLPGSHCR